MEKDYWEERCKDIIEKAKDQEDQIAHQRTVIGWLIAGLILLLMVVLVAVINTGTTIVHEGVPIEQVADTAVNICKELRP
jgi:predicted nucleic acid-binding Zn ribbon protein